MNEFLYLQPGDRYHASENILLARLMLLYTAGFGGGDWTLWRDNYFAF